MTVTEHASLADYLTGVLHEVQPLRPLQLSLLDSAGCRLADEVRAPAPLPAFDLAQVTGYAVRAEDVRMASSEHPITLSVVGDIGIGAWQAVGVPPGGCFAISAGAPLPGGADAVVPRELTDDGMVKVRIEHAARANENVLWSGAECAAGTVIASAGELMTPGLIGLVASAGFAQLPAYPIPRVVALSIGDELVDIGHPGCAGHIIDAASYTVTAGARAVGAQAFRLSTIGDDPDRLNSVLEDNAMRADLLVVTGVNLTRVIGQLFSEVRFVTLPVAPNGVFGFGRIGAERTPIVCLPGEAASAFVGFELVVRPIIQRLAGAEHVFRRSIKASLAEAISSVPGKREFRPCAVSQRRGGGYAVRPLPGGTHVLTGLAKADGLMVIGDRASTVPSGAQVDVLLLER